MRQEDIFGAAIYTYTRAQAIEDGVLTDMTDWAREVGFVCPVAVTASVWSDINDISEQSSQDPRGRAHDLLWMARCAAKKTEPGENVIRFALDLPTSRTWRRHDFHGAHERTYKAVAGPGDTGELVITIMQLNED